MSRCRDGDIPETHRLSELETKLLHALQKVLVGDRQRFLENLRNINGGPDERARNERRSI